MKPRYALLLASLLLLAPAAFAATGFQGILSGVQEVPANGSPGTGTATAILDNSGTSLTCTVTFSGLTAGLTASHIHRAAVGVSGPIVFPFTPPTGVTSGTYTNTFTLTAANVADLVAGLYYVNIHTSTFPGGEIRAQLNGAPTASGKSTWGRIKALYR